MYRILRTDYTNADFQQLVNMLDKDLAQRDGEEHSFYAQFNKISGILHAIVLYRDDEPAGCGALREFDTETMEVKRMYVTPQKRGQGVASIVLKKLEAWAKEMNYKKCVLETGLRQPEAIRLYEKNNYRRIPNYGQYRQTENSVCFEKEL